MGCATKIMPDNTKLRVNGTWWHSILMKFEEVYGRTYRGRASLEAAEMGMSERTFRRIAFRPRARTTTVAWVGFPGAAHGVDDLAPLEDDLFDTKYRKSPPGILGEADSTEKHDFKRSYRTAL